MFDWFLKESVHVLNIRPYYFNFPQLSMNVVPRRYDERMWTSQKPLESLVPSFPMSCVLFEICQIARESHVLVKWFVENNSKRNREGMGRGMKSKQYFVRKEIFMEKSMGFFLSNSLNVFFSLKFSKSLIFHYLLILKLLNFCWTVFFSPLLYIQILMIIVLK